MIKHICVEPSFVAIYPDTEHLNSGFKLSERTSIYPHVCTRFTDVNKNFKTLVSPPDFRYQTTSETLFSYTTVFNSSGRSVNIKDHNNVVRKFKPKDGGDRAFIKIFTTYSLQNPFYVENSKAPGIDINQDLYDYYQRAIDNYEQAPNKLLDEVIMVYKMLLKYDEEVVKSGKYNPKINNEWIPEHLLVVIETEIDADELNDEKSLYVTNKNLVISFEPLHKVPDHPWISKFNPLENTEDDDSYHICFKLVDNDSTIGTRFVNVGSQAVELSPIRDTSKENGLYVHTKQRGRIDTTKFSIEELASAKYLYKTKLEALEHMDIDMLVKKSTEGMKRDFEQQKQEHELKLAEMQAEVSKSKSEYEKTKAERETTTGELKLQVERISSESARQKAKADNLLSVIKIESARQKAKADNLLFVIKIGGAVVTTSLGLFLILSKNR